MANPEHLEILEQGVELWNKWRKNHPKIRPNLRVAKLSGMNLKLADLTGAKLSGADLTEATLTYANLTDAKLTDAKLSHAILWNAHLCGADLTLADLWNADLWGANFTDADLSYSELQHTNFNRTILRGTKFNKARMGNATFGNIDLSEAVGLETVGHIAPSTVGTDTLYLSGGKIPESFLRGCGIPDDFITYMHSLTVAGQPIQFYSCFISYSSKDQDFAERLYADLQNKGVRCWFAPEDLKIGDKIRDRIDESIRLRDKLLLILSEHSIASEWVEHEVESALEEERQRGR
nr:toll/interleukin-1 receptor domain-containing protein [Acidobacteriota bacterium]